MDIEGYVDRVIEGKSLDGALEELDREALEVIDDASKNSDFEKFKSKFDDYKRNAELIISKDENN